MEQNNQEKILEATKDKQTGHDESVLKSNGLERKTAVYLDVL